MKVCENIGIKTCTFLVHSVMVIVISVCCGGGVVLENTNQYAFILIDVKETKFENYSWMKNR